MLVAAVLEDFYSSQQSGQQEVESGELYGLMVSRLTSEPGVQILALSLA